VQSLLKAEDGFEEKSRKFDAIWILKMVLIIVSGIDMTMITFITMKQYSNEVNDAFLAIFKSKVKTLKLAGEHTCS